MYITNRAWSQYRSAWCSTGCVAITTPNHCDAIYQFGQTATGFNLLDQPPFWDLVKDLTELHVDINYTALFNTLVISSIHAIKLLKQNLLLTTPFWLSLINPCLSKYRTEQRVSVKGKTNSKWDHNRRWFSRSRCQCQSTSDIPFVLSTLPPLQCKSVFIHNPHSDEMLTTSLPMDAPRTVQYFQHFVFYFRFAASAIYLFNMSTIPIFSFIMSPSLVFMALTLH